MEGVIVENQVKKKYWVFVIAIICFLLGVFTLAFAGLGLAFLLLATYLANKSNVVKVTSGRSVVPSILVVLISIILFKFYIDSFGQSTLLAFIWLIIAIIGSISSIKIYVKNKHK